MLLKIHLLAIGISWSGVVFALDMPSIDLEGYSPRKEGDVFKCDYRTLQDIGDLPEEKAYQTYAYYYERVSAWQETIPYRKKLYVAIYKQIHNELGDHPEIKLRNGGNDKNVWDVPIELSEVFLYWSRSLNGNKSEIERDMCLFYWYRQQKEKYSSMPSKFIVSYNALYDSYMEVKNRCEKPDIQGWTQEQAAKDYAKCINGSRQEHNNTLRTLKSYQPLRGHYAAILESLDMEHQLKPAL